MIKSLEVTLTPKSPLCLPIESRSNFPESANFIPGRMFRGALGAQYLREETKDEFFTEIFLNEKAIFTNLYPVNNSDKISYPSPMTTLSCKRYLDEHGIYDSMFLHGAREVFLIEHKELKDISNIYRCPICHNDLKSHNNFYYLEESKVIPTRLSKSIQMHTGINRETGTVEESIFYGLESIEPESIEGNFVFFKGTINFNEELAESFIDKFNKKEIYIGRAKTRGNGLSEVSVKIIESSTDKDFSSRLEKWDEDFTIYCKEIFNFHPDGFYFGVTLASEAILLDKFLRYSSEISSLEFANCIYKSIKSKTIKGWNSTYNLPIQAELAVSEGSCYLFEVPVHQKQEAIEILNKLEVNGIGVRKSEGFGRVYISDDFHSIKAIR